jgi:hypothetical protein
MTDQSIFGSTCGPFVGASEEAWESADPALGKLCSPRAEQQADQPGWRPIPVSAERCMIIQLRIRAARRYIRLHAAALCRLCRMSPKLGPSQARRPAVSNGSTWNRWSEPVNLPLDQPPRFCKCENMLFGRARRLAWPLSPRFHINVSVQCWSAPLEAVMESRVSWIDAAESIQNDADRMYSMWRQRNDLVSLYSSFKPEYIKPFDLPLYAQQQHGLAVSTVVKVHVEARPADTILQHDQYPPSCRKESSRPAALGSLAYGIS